MDKIVFIANFGEKSNKVDGQIIKTKIVFDELSRRTNWHIIKVNTSRIRRNPASFFLSLLRALIATKSVIVMVSSNGRRVLFPILYFFAKFLNRNVYHIAIGGVLAYEAEESGIYRMFLNSFRANFVETRLLAEELKGSGVRNGKILPNFRQSMPLREAKLENAHGEPFSLCTFSRVTREKGIDDAVRAIKNVNEKNGRVLCTLCIFGPVDADYKDHFETLLEDAGPAVWYGGIIPYDSAIRKLSEFYAVLFPTYCASESQAGTISDSLSAGVPVIATDWRCNREMIRDGYNGIIYPGETASTLEEAIQWMADHPEKMPQLKRNCIRSARRYQPDACMPRLIHFIEEGEGHGRGGRRAK